MSERMWLAEELEKARTARDRLARELEQAQAREAGLREALRWYASLDNEPVNQRFYIVDENGEHIATFASFTSRAQAALASEQQT